MRRIGDRIDSKKTTRLTESNLHGAGRIATLYTMLVQRCIVYYIILYLYVLRINDAYRMEVSSYRTNKQSADIRKG
jgi:uncharacterized membrane protein